MVPTIEELRLQCRIDEDDDSEDALLTIYVGAARRSAENFTNRKLYDDSVPEDQSEGLLITDDIKLAIMLVVGHWFENREDSSEVQKLSIPLGFKALLEPYRFIPL